MNGRLHTLAVSGLAGLLLLRHRVLGLRPTNNDRSPRILSDQTLSTLGSWRFLPPARRAKRACKQAIVYMTRSDQLSTVENVIGKIECHRAARQPHQADMVRHWREQRGHDNTSNRIERPGDERDSTHRHLASNSHLGSSFWWNCELRREAALESGVNSFSSRLGAGDVSFTSSHTFRCSYTFNRHATSSQILCSTHINHSRISTPLTTFQPFQNNQPNHISKCPAPWLPLLLVNSPSVSRSPSLVSLNKCLMIFSTTS